MMRLTYKSYSMRTNPSMPYRRPHAHASAIRSSSGSDRQGSRPWPTSPQMSTSCVSVAPPRLVALPPSK